jgi:hypothetical protein
VNPANDVRGIVPELSVIVTAWDRRQFLAQALESVENRLPASTEVVVVANFSDPGLEAHVRANDGQWVISREIRQGAMLLDGALAARGSAIALLDDDDLCAPDRLQEVLRAFRGDPSLGFFHNGNVVFADGSVPLYPRESERQTPMRIGPRDRSDERLKVAWGAGPAYNSSSVAVRRTLLLGGRARLLRITRGIAPFLFFRAWTQPHSLVIDPRPLTAVRAHAANTSPAPHFGFRERLERYARLSNELASDARVILELLPAGTWAVPLEHVVSLESLLEFGPGAPAPRAGAARAALLLLRGGPTWLPRREFLAIAVVKAVSPHTARAMVSRWVRGSGPPGP